MFKYVKLLKAVVVVFFRSRRGYTAVAANATMRRRIVIARHRVGYPLTASQCAVVRHNYLKNVSHDYKEIFSVIL